MRVQHLRALILAQDYRIDPRLVAEALLARVRASSSVTGPAGARSRPADPERR